MPPCLQKPSLKHDYVLFRVNSLCPFCTDAPPRTAGAFCFFCPSNILSRHCTLCLCYHAGHLYANDITSNVLSYHPLLSVGTTSRTINQWAKMQHTLFIATRINVHYDIIPSVRVGFLFEQQDGSFCGRRRCCVCVLVPTKKNTRGCVHTVSYKTSIRLALFLLEALCICKQKQLFLWDTRRLH